MPSGFVSLANVWQIAEDLPLECLSNGNATLLGIALAGNVGVHISFFFNLHEGMINPTVSATTQDALQKSMNVTRLGIATK